MKRQQIVLCCGAVLLVVVIAAFGNFIPPKNKMAAMAGAPMAQQATALTTDEVLAAAKAKLTPEAQERITTVENDVIRGDVKSQKISQYRQLSSFWADSARNMPLGTYYKGEAAKLENSEKDLTFAARKLLSYTMAEQSVPMQMWMAGNAKELFEQALKINPADDSAQVGLGACYMFGNLSSNPMQEILKVRAVADRDSTNLYAQMILGLGDVKTGQYTNAVKRFQAVINKQPLNLEAIFNIADVYDRLQDKTNAVKWYKVAQQLIQVPEAKKEIQDRIGELETE